MEIWGWKERKELRRVARKVFEVAVEDRVGHMALGYMVREELQRVKLRCRARGRAWNFAKLIGGGQKKWVLASDGWEEVRNKIKKGKGRSKWEEERIGYFEEKGVEMWEKERRKEGAMDFGHMMKKDMDRSERWENIGEAKYNNRWYGRIKGEGVLSYLKKS